MIVAGFGFRVSATKASFADAFGKAAAQRSVACLATAQDKAHAEAFQAFATGTTLPIHMVENAALAAQKTQTQSAASRAARGTGSVAEAAALAAAGKDATLIVARVISADGLATCALAKGKEA